MTVARTEGEFISYDHADVDVVIHIDWANRSWGYAAVPCSQSFWSRLWRAPRIRFTVEEKYAAVPKNLLPGTCESCGSRGTRHAPACSKAFLRE